MSQRTVKLAAGVVARLPRRLTDSIEDLGVPLVGRYASSVEADLLDLGHSTLAGRLLTDLSRLTVERPAASR